MSVDPLLQLTIAWCLAALLALSAAHQVLAWNEWPGIVRNHRLLPDSLTPLAAVSIPVCELLAAGAIVWPPTRGAGGMASGLLFAGFGVALAINLLRGRVHIDCGCFGVRLRGTLAPWMVVRNLLLVFLAWCLTLPVTQRDVSFGEQGMALVWVATLAFLYPVLDVALRRR
jgi:hypothetical protein